MLVRQELRHGAASLLLGPFARQLLTENEEVRHVDVGVHLRDVGLSAGLGFRFQRLGFRFEGLGFRV